MLVDARFPALVRIRYGCGVQSCYQKLNLQVFSRGDFRELFRNFEKFWAIFGNILKFFKIIFWSGISENLGVVHWFWDEVSLIVCAGNEITVNTCYR